MKGGCGEGMWDVGMRRWDKRKETQTQAMNKQKQAANKTSYK